MKGLLLVISMILYSQWGLGAVGGSRSNAFEDYQDSWTLTIGGGVTSRVLKHAETSADTSYSSIGEDVRVSDRLYGLSLQKEFLTQKRFSFTAQLAAGMSSGDYESDDENLSSFKEELDYVHFGVGVSLNYNSFLYGYKVQPYVGVLLRQEDGEYNLSHEANGDNLITLTEFSDMVADLGLGVRIFDSDVGLMSFFQITMPQVLSESIEASGQVGSSNVALTSVAEIQRAPLLFSLGFGFFF